MSLRDQFAREAMNGILASPTTVKVKPEFIAKYAYAMADAILAERNKPLPKQKESNDVKTNSK